MFSFLMVSTLIALSSAADKKPEDRFISSVSKALAHATDHAAGDLASSWAENKNTDQKSVDTFLERVSDHVVTAVKDDVINVVKSTLGEAVKTPERSDMFRTLRDVIRRQATELTLGKAKLFRNNDAVKVNNNGKDGDIKTSNIYDGLFNEIRKKNVTEEEKEKLFNDTKGNIDAIVNSSMKSEVKSKDEVASRSGNFFYNNHLQQQQQRYSSSLAQRLTHQVMNDMVHNPCRTPCHNPCYNTALGRHGLSGFQRHLSTNHHSGVSNLCGGSGLAGDGLTIDAFGGILGNTYNHHHGMFGDNGYSGSNFNSLRDSSLSRASDVNSLGYSGTGGSGVKGYYSGLANLWSLGDNTKDSSGSAFGRYGSNGLGGSLYGTNSLGSGQSSLFNSGSSFNSLGGSSLYGNAHGSNYGSLGGLSGFNGLGNGLSLGTGVGNGLANIVGTGGHKGSHYSVSNSRSSSSSSQSDSSKNHVSFGNSNNMW